MSGDEAIRYVLGAAWYRAVVTEEESAAADIELATLTRKAAAWDAIVAIASDARSPWAPNVNQSRRFAGLLRETAKKVGSSWREDA